MNEARIRDIVRALCRIPIQRGQLVLYRLATGHPEDGFTSGRVRELLDLDQAAHRGMMAALTVRINNTPRETSPNEKAGLSLMFHQTWDGHENTYRPRAELLAAIQKLPKLHDMMQRSIKKVMKVKPLRLVLPSDVPVRPPTPPSKSHAKTSANSFDALLNTLDKADLVYPAELVANLLLSLQVKRFVLLTGISGTGKTRIAQVLAERFSVRRRVQAPTDPGDQGALLTVMPYMHKYRRMILPQALAVQIPALSDINGSGKLRVRWPGGTTELTVWVRNAVQVLFKNPLRAWFDETFSEGDTLLAQIDGPEDGPPDTLVLATAPRAKVREEQIQNAVLMAVRPDWTDHRGLLGAYNPLTRQYLVTPFLRLMIRAQEEHNRRGDKAAPFFLLLDEMNLARVEHYFADFLSAMESGEPLHLHDSIEVEEGLADTEDQALPIPRQLVVPPNLFFIGTVNVDESTYMFSPKVLDRAFTIELNSVDLSGLATGMERGGDLILGKWNGQLDPPARAARADWLWLTEQEDGALSAQVQAFHSLLAHHNRHFGYRVATELARFVRLAAEQADEPGGATWAALDLALLQKVLVKLHGTRQELSGILDALLRLTLVGESGDATSADLNLWRYIPEEAVVRRQDESADVDAIFPRSAAKLWRMRERLRETGFTSWIE